ncbi:MAG: hypothetical protein WAT70_08035 [Rhizobiaceae bacterium]
MSGAKIFSASAAGRLMATPAGYVPFTGHACVLGVWLDTGLGLLSVEHDGAIGFDALQAVKNAVWGREAAAIEVYPPASRLIDNVPMRHLWLLGPEDFWPDLGHEGASAPRRLAERYALAAAGVA